MNLVKTLAKVAMGVMVARGVGKMMGGKGQSGSGGAGGGLGGLGGLLGGGAQRSGSGSSDIGRGIGGSDGVGGLSGGSNSSSTSQGSSQNSGGLGGLLESLTKGGLGQQSGSQSAPSAGGGSGGGLADILGSVLGGGAAGGGLGDLLESLGGGKTAQNNPQVAANNQGSCEQPSQPASSGSLGGLLNQAFGGQAAQPQPEQNAQAELMLRGMLNAAKSDGKFDQAEQQKVTEHLGDISKEEMEFVQNEMRQPLDVDAFVRSIPRGLEQQVYVMSLLGIELDSQAEAQYLDRLAQGLGISQSQANSIHDQVGVPKLYG